MKFKFSILVFLTFITGLTIIKAQKNAWVDMFSYLKVKHVQALGDKIYAQSENALFIYDDISGDIDKISSINGLTGDNISNFYYHDGLKKLFIFHQGGLIEIVDQQKNVFRSPELSYNTFIPIDKKVLNSIFVTGNQLYLATKYGISIYNLDRNEFGDTYYFGISGNADVYSTAIYNQKIYAATSEGLYRANISDNLIDQNVWTKIDPGHWHNLRIYNQKLIGIIGNDIKQILDPGFQTLLNFNENIQGISINHFFSVRFAHHIKVYDSNLIFLNDFQDNIYSNEKFYDVTDTSDYIFIASNKHGVLKTPVNQINFETIHPDCPLSNHAYALDARDNVLWMAYGDLFELNPYPVYKEGLSSYQNKSWLNIPYQNFNISDVSFVKINPTNTNEVYFASPKNGLIRVRNNQIDKIFNQNNSPLTMLGTDGVRVFDIDFDKENNLWVSHTPHPYLLKLKPDDTWEPIDLTNLLPTFSNFRGSTDMIVDEDRVYMASESYGVIGYNAKTGQIAYNKNGIQTNAYPSVKTLDLDKDDVLWIGNNAGLRILSNPEDIFTNPDKEFKPIKIVYEDAVQLLMEGQNITKITVDGSNNKWIATLGSGVYYFNEDGTKTIYHFTKENSPLPSNDIYDVAVDGSNGMVYFATLQGLTGYKGFATEGGENMDDVYAFPNPANQKEHQFVTIRGLITGVNVKIVDVEGNLVYETVSKGGSIQWDLSAFGKYKVASGVYIALITNEDGTKTQTTKILVIK